MLPWTGQLKAIISLPSNFVTRKAQIPSCRLVRCWRTKSITRSRGWLVAPLLAFACKPASDFSLTFQAVNLALFLLSASPLALYPKLSQKLL